jgi:hypothetical protein
MTPLNVLISLHRGYGLGDAVQMSAVLSHVQKYRPHWSADFQAEAGRHCIGRGLVANHFEFGKNPNPDKVYDAEVEMCLYDTWYNWQDRPNTRVSSCLHERFGMAWDAECGRYRVEVSLDAMEAAKNVLRGMWGFGGRFRTEPRWVAVHHRGDSAPDKKNLTDEQADAVCDRIAELGCVPLLLDWRGTSPLANRYGTHTTGRGHYSREWGGNAEMNCAVIRQCAAFVGIDSGPSKCASTTDVPALVVWTGHHPAQFHDPAPNTTHLVPHGYHGLEPVCNDPGVTAWFEAHHQIRQYKSDPVDQIRAWLTEVLN